MKILLVDDEYYILNGLYQLIHARFPELEIFTGDYVTKAREILYREKPDILITDIRIAEENGLDFIKSIKTDFPQMHVYIISGYSEFEYAKTAIELNVRYYILKPINQKKVVELVRQSMEEIVQERTRRENEIKTLVLAKKKVVLDMILEGGCSEELQEEVKRLGLASLFAGYRVVNISIKEYWTIATYSRSVQLSNLKMFIRNKLDDILREAAEDCYLCIEDETGNYTLITGVGEEILNAVLEQIYAVIYEDFRLYTEFQVSSRYEGELNFYAAYCESRGIGTKASRLLFYSGSESRIVKELEKIRYKAVDTMEQENYIQLASLIELMTVRFSREYAENRVVQNFSKELYRDIVSYLRAKMAEAHIDFNYEPADVSADSTEYGRKKLADAYTALAENLRTCQQQMNARKNREMIKKVIAYMDEDISRASLDSAADYVDTTPIYLSIIFKEVEGIHFKECLIQKKIERAKRLLEDTDLHIYEIGAFVGYADIKYFSRMFKRYVGISPQEYRNQSEENKEEHNR